LTYLGVFYLAVLANGSRDIQRRLLVGLIGLGLVQALYGLVQYLTGWHQVYRYKNIFYPNRASGTFVNPNHFAGFLELVLPLALGYAVYRLFRRGPHGERGAIPLLVIFIALLLFLGILFSRSRMGIFSAVAAVTAMMLLWASRSWKGKRVVAATIIFLFVASLLGVWVGIQPVVERYEQAEADVLIRLAIWKDTLRLIQAQPLFGTGLGSFATVYTHAQSGLFTRVVDHAHNDYLETTVELGLLGAGLLFGLIGFVLVRAAQAFSQTDSNWDRSLLWGGCGSVLALLFHSLTDFNLQIPANAMMLAVVLGLVYSTSTNVRSNSSTQPAEGRVSDPRSIRSADSRVRCDLSLRRVTNR
jgi:O-antigen ligase